MSLIGVFVGIWVVVVVVWLLLDRLGEPSIGRFRPQRERQIPARSRKGRRRRRRARRDTDVRTVLRTEYGKSSLRREWDETEESAALAADDDAIAAHLHPPRVVPVNGAAPEPEDPVPENPVPENPVPENPVGDDEAEMRNPAYRQRIGHDEP